MNGGVTDPTAQMHLDNHLFSGDVSGNNFFEHPFKSGREGLLGFYCFYGDIGKKYLRVVFHNVKYSTKMPAEKVFRSEFQILIYCFYQLFAVKYSVKWKKKESD